MIGKKTAAFRPWLNSAENESLDWLIDNKHWFEREQHVNQ